MFSIILLIILILLIPTAIAGISGAPLALTKKKQIKEIIEKADIKETDKFYELGTGTGRMMIRVSKETKAEVIGFELSPIYYFITFINLKINRVKNSKLYLKNFFSANLKEADVVFLFLMPNSLKKLKGKFKKGTKIISFCFPIEYLKPYLIIKKEKQLPVYFYFI